MKDDQPVIELTYSLHLTVSKDGTVTDAKTGCRTHIDSDVTKIVVGSSNYANKEDPLPFKWSPQSYYLPLIYDLIKVDALPRRLSSRYVYVISGDEAEIITAFDPTFGGPDKDLRPVTPGLFARDEYHDSKHPLLQILANLKRLQDKVPHIPKSIFDSLIGACQDAGIRMRKSGYISTIGRIDSFYLNTENDSWTFLFSFETKLYYYFWGEYMDMLPTPKLPDPGKPPKHGQLLGIGKNSWVKRIFDHVLSELNSIVRNIGEEIVFIQGEPGSGKEIIANIIHFGSVREKWGEDGLKQRSVANMTTDQLQELLFGKISDGNRIPGLIEKANGGTLFLDEFDKIADKSFYSELLRVLEAKEYVPVNGGEVLKFSNVNWVFAGAFTGQSPSCAASDLPVDFWSRLTARMTIENPFGFDGAAGHWSYAGGLFLYFFMREIVAFAEGASSLLDERKGDFRAHLARKIMGLHNTSSLEDSLIGGIAREFQARISSGRYDVYRLHSNQSVAFRSHHTRRVLASRGRSGRPDEWLSTMGRLYKLDNPPDRPTLDSARSVRQAAKAAFAELIRQLLANPELPLTPPTDRGENQGDGDAIGTALNRAVNAVYRGRPRVMEDRELLPPGLPLYPLP